MEVEKIAPIATSPLDSARGRGKLRISTPRRRKEHKEHKEHNTYDIDTPMGVVLYIHESQTRSVARK
jgi:hypothetical protein